VLAAIGAAEDRFYLREIAAATGIPDSTIAPILRHLEEVELLRSIERLRTNGPQFYERREHPIWNLAAEIVDATPTADHRAETANGQGQHSHT
jgi:DNA-binding IclR family transcriptional regulator